MSTGLQQLTQHLRSNESLLMMNQQLRDSFSENDVEILKKRGHYEIPHTHESKDSLDCSDISPNYKEFELDFKDFVKIPEDKLNFDILRKLKGVCGFIQFLNSSSWATTKHLHSIQIYDILTLENYRDFYTPELTDFSELVTDVLILKDIRGYYAEIENPITEEDMSDYSMRRVFSFDTNIQYTTRGNAIWIPRGIYESVIVNS